MTANVTANSGGRGDENVLELDNGNGYIIL